MRQRQGMESQSQLEYYQQHNFNPVKIEIEDLAGWQSQIAKRRNLYEKHLGLPLSLFRGRNVLEFGCNSGENSLVLASVGADLTLVEPNDQVISRLEDLFAKFNLRSRITSLVNDDFESFQSNDTYEIVLAEGFLFNLAKRDSGLSKICGLLSPGGIGIISFIDRHASLVHATRQLLLWRACYLSGIEDIGSPDSLNLAHELFNDDFSSIAASRPFEVWWKDALVSPWTNNHLWSYQEIIPIIEQAGCEFHSSSPKWATVDAFDWYKNVHTPSERHQSLLRSWGASFPYFMTGMPQRRGVNPLPEHNMLQRLLTFIGEISDYTAPKVSSKPPPTYPEEVHSYFTRCKDPDTQEFSNDLKNIYRSAKTDSLPDLLATYHSCRIFRRCWGAHYHYVSFVKTD